MSFYSAARGTVVEPPARVTSETGEIAVLVLRDATAGHGGVEYQVSCPDRELGSRVLEQVRDGDQLLVLGSIRLDAVSSPIEDGLSAARVTFVADVVAVRLHQG
jgi:hypothetical protein